MLKSSKSEAAADAYGAKLKTSVTREDVDQTVGITIAGKERGLYVRGNSTEERNCGFRLRSCSFSKQKLTL